MSVWKIEESVTAESSAVYQKRNGRPWLISWPLLILLSVTVLVSTVNANGDSDEKQVEFQGRSWIAPDTAELAVETYRGHESIRIQSLESSVVIKGLMFSEGKLEFDLALAGRIPPWICFHNEAGKEPDRLRVNPWKKPEAATAPRLRQAVLTRRESNYLVLNYHQTDAEYDPGRWTHVCIVSKDGLSRIYIDHDEAPVIVLDMSFAFNEIAIEGSCFIRNVTATREGA